MPNFLILGAAKSGTTSLVHMLKRHPEVFFSTPKEPVFFELEYGRGLEYYAETYLTGWAGQRAIGEGRVYNLYLPYVPERIAASLPDAKLIVILRNPVDRAYSHWWHRVTRGYERRQFDELVSEELPRLERGDHFPLRESEQLWRQNFHPNARQSRTMDLKEIPCLEMGYYAEQLTRYLRFFPASQLEVFLFDDLRLRSAWLIRRLHDFLQITESQEHTKTIHGNVAQQQIKSPLAFHLERLSWSLGVAELIPKSVRSRIRELFPERPARRPPLPDEMRRHLSDHYQAANARLEELIGRDLPEWSSLPRTSSHILNAPENSATDRRQS